MRNSSTFLQRGFEFFAVMASSTSFMKRPRSLRYTRVFSAHAGIVELWCWRAESKA